jgi:hypothetical protein
MQFGVAQIDAAQDGKRRRAGSGFAAMTVGSTAG